MTAPTFSPAPNAILHSSGQHLTKAEALSELAHHLALSKSLNACDACRETAGEMVRELSDAIAASWPETQADGEAA